MAGPNNNSDEGKLSRGDIKRIGDVVKRVERQPRNSRPPQRQYPVMGAPGAIPAITGAGGIPAGSYAAPTTVTVTLLVNQNNTAALGKGNPPTTVTVNNTYTSSIGANVLIWIVNFNGFWYLLTSNC